MLYYTDARGYKRFRRILRGSASSSCMLQDAQAKLLAELGSINYHHLGKTNSNTFYTCR